MLGRIFVRRNNLIFLGVALLLLLGGCSQEKDSRTLTVSVASSLIEPFQDIHNTLTTEYGKGVALFGNYGSSGSLASQIVQGASVDLFVTADFSYMEILAEKGLLVEDPLPIGVNSLIMVFSPKVVDLPQSGDVAELITVIQEQNLSVATGEPDSVPLGQYAKQGLGDSWNVVAPQLVFAKNANSAKYYFVSGSVDGAILYSSDRKDLPEGTTVYPIAPEVFVTYYIGVLSDTEPELTQWYIEFLQSRGTEILKTYGIGAIP